MSRAIRFRAWDIEAKAMVPWETILRECDRLSFLSLEHYEIMQFADLKDLDWWEGDILEHVSGIYVIKWVDGGLYVHGPDGLSPIAEAIGWAIPADKVGNIHEHPELLE